MSELNIRDAEFSADRRYRYRLWRRWAFGPKLVVIGLNPSTADEQTDDPTVRRCVGYARQWGFSAVEMLNLFAYRATDPKAMMAVVDTIGPEWQENARIVASQCRIAGLENGAVLAAWGAHGTFKDAWKSMYWLLGKNAPGSACLGLTKAGQPRHPLYLPQAAKPIVYTGDGGRLVTKWTPDVLGVARAQRQEQVR